MARRRPFETTWDTRKAIRVGFLTGRGHQSHEIAEALADGTTSHTIRRMWSRAKLGKIGKERNEVEIRIVLTSYQRKALGILASAMNLSAEEWLRRIAAAAIKDDMYNAIVDEETTK